jgi:hypothetical protein
MEKDSPGFPPPSSLTGRRKPFPYFFLTDKSYVVQENIIKIYFGLYQKGPVERLFNYRLSRTHRVVKRCVWNHFLIFPSTTEAIAVTTRTARLILMTIAHVYNAVRQNTYSANFIHHFAHLIMRLMVLESRETGTTWTGELGVHHFPSKYTM